MDNWITLSLIVALLSALTNTVNKHLNTNLNEYSAAWARNLFSLPVFWIALFLSGVPHIDTRFWPLLILIAPVELLVATFYFKGIKSSPLSISMPISSFNSLFIALGAYFLLSEKLTGTHFLAFALLVLGSYLLNIKLGKNHDLFYPFKHLKNEKGALYMLIAALLFGIVVPVGKILTSFSSSQFYTAVYFSLFVILFTPIFLKKGTDGLKGIGSNITPVLLMGLLNGTYLFLLWRAYSMGPAGLVNAVTSLNILLSVIFAGTFLKEKELPKRLIATVIMTVGVLLVTLTP